MKNITFFGYSDFSIWMPLNIGFANLKEHSVVVYESKNVNNVLFDIFFLSSYTAHLWCQSVNWLPG